MLIIASFQISSAQHIPMACQLCQLLCLRHWGHGEEQMKKSFCLSKSNMQEQIIRMHSKLLSGIYSTLFSFTFDSIHSYFLKFLLSAPFTGFSSCVCPFGADISKVLGLALFSSLLCLLSLGNIHMQGLYPVYHQWFPSLYLQT